MSSIPYETPNTPHGLEFPDQRGGMKALGIVMIVMGAFAFCAAGATPLALLAPRVQGVPGPQARDMFAGAAMYALGAVVLVTAGVGSLRGRRWSRPVILILSGSWAIGGLVGLVTWIIVGPDVERAMATMNATTAAQGPPGAPAPPAGMPASMAATIRIVTVVMLVVFGVLLPGGYFWFYVRDSVRRTVDYFDQAPSWTDRCPTPVLGLSVWLGLIALFTLSFCMWGVIPFFGRLVTGPVAIVTLIVLAGLLGMLAVETFRLNKLAWWGTAILLVLYLINNAVTFSQVDPIEFQRLAGMPPEALQMMEQMDTNSRATTIFTAVLYAVVGLGYLFWVRRHFNRDPRPAVEAASAP